VNRERKGGEGTVTIIGGAEERGLSRQLLPQGKVAPCGLIPMFLWNSGHPDLFSFRIGGCGVAWPIEVVR